jgi:5'-deoxynucleotidase
MEERNNIDSCHFFANLSRLKLIYRWPLMRTVTPENVQEHSHQVATVTHILCLIKNKMFEGNISVEKAVLTALYHDASEVLTGDLPSPIKYHNAEIAHEYKKIEAIAEKTLIKMLPNEFHEDFEKLIVHEQIEPEVAYIVKSADVICGYLKAMDELAAGNHEFEKARKNIEQTMEKYTSPEVRYFLDVFVPSFSLSLDEISTPL